MENDYKKLMENIHAPEKLNERVLCAARRQAAVETGPKRLAKRNWKPVLRGAACALCALALVLGTVRLYPVEPAVEETTHAAESLSVLPHLTYGFGLTAYAAETGEITVPNANGGLAFVASAGMAGVDIGHYTGCLFRINGTGIRAVTLSIDRGGLYRSEDRTNLSEKDVQALYREQEEGGFVCSVSSRDGRTMTAEVMTPLGGSVREDFDAAVSYGFWVPPEEYALEDENGDLRQLAHESIDFFDGARLTVAVTFADGTEESKTYTLSTDRLRTEYGEDGTRTMLPQLAGDDEPYVYGVYAVSETESTWFAWPVEGANTIDLSAPYGEFTLVLTSDPPAGETTMFHAGIDIPAAQGTVILAAADGTVTETGFDTERGNYLVLDHGNGLTTLYAQCRNVDVETGDTVKAGEMVAAVGATGMATGPHLHFEVRQDGEAQNPVAYFDSDIRDTLKME